MSTPHAQERATPTTFCDLKNHRIYDITRVSRKAAWELYSFLRLEGKEQAPVCLHGSGRRLRFHRLKKQF